MARKREALKGLEYRSPEYWNRLLAEEGLTMEQGNDPRLIYIGGSTEIERLEGVIRTDDGRVRQPQDNEEE